MHDDKRVWNNADRQCSSEQVHVRGRDVASWVFPDRVCGISERASGDQIGKRHRCFAYIISVAPLCSDVGNRSTWLLRRVEGSLGAAGAG